VNRSPRIAALVVCALCSAAAQAVPVVYDFTGTGWINTYTGVGSATTTTNSVNFNGWVSIDVLAPGPDGTDGYTDLVYETAYDYSGWVQSDFFIDWGSGSFNPTAGPGILLFSDMYATTGYAGVYDQLYNREFYQSIDQATLTNFVSQATLNRQTSDISWLSDLSFDQSVGLAPDPNGNNGIQFSNYSYNLAGDHSGFQGTVLLTSLTARTTSVPEPVSLALFGLGVLGIGAVRRRLRT